MKISATYSELKCLLQNKVGKDIEIEYGGTAETVLVRYMHFPCYVRIEKIDLKSVTLSYSIGGDFVSESPDVTVDPCPSPRVNKGGLFRRGARNLVNRALGVFVKDVVNFPSVTVNEGGTLNVDLSKIPQLSKVLEMAVLDTVFFSKEGVSINLLIEMSDKLINNI